LWEDILLQYLILGVTFAFANAVQPGPLQTYLIAQALSKGWRHTLPAVFAPLISDGPIIVLVFFLLSSIPNWLVQILQFAGGLFPLYLAFNAYRTWRDFGKGTIVTDASSQQTLLKAVLVNVLSPIPYLGWSLVMGPLLLKTWQTGAINGIALLVSFYISVVLTLIGIILLFSYARALGPRVNRALIGLSAIALAGFGIYQLGLGFKTLFTG
jgi:threonine/homoserine/homoserine lactone efflux protein